MDNFIQFEIASAKMEKKLWKQRGYSVPKHIENILRKHTAGL